MDFPFSSFKTLFYGIRQAFTPFKKDPLCLPVCVCLCLFGDELRYPFPKIVPLDEFFFWENTAVDGKAEAFLLGFSHAEKGHQEI